MAKKVEGDQTPDEPKEEGTEAEASTEGLVVMVKPGHKVAYVHPTTVKSHKDAGWLEA